MFNQPFNTGIADNSVQEKNLCPEFACVFLDDGRILVMTEIFDDLNESLSLEAVLLFGKELTVLYMLCNGLCIELIEPQLHIILIAHHRMMHLRQL